MANIFKQNLDVTQHPSRNNFDLTHKVHGTYKFGTIYPFLCKPVVPGDSFEIDTACGFQFMPMPFPTQSNMRVIFHYFYVRNKNIWENWENFAQGLEEHTPPYIDKPASFYKTGSLADYLDIPTSLSIPLEGVNSYPYVNNGASLLFDLRSNAFSNYLSGRNVNTLLKDFTKSSQLTSSDSPNRIVFVPFYPKLDFYSSSNERFVLANFTFKRSDLTTLGLSFNNIPDSNSFLDFWVSEDGNFQSSKRVLPNQNYSSFLSGMPLKHNVAYNSTTDIETHTFILENWIPERYAFPGAGNYFDSLSSLIRYHSDNGRKSVFFTLSLSFSNFVNFSLTDPESPADYIEGSLNGLISHVPYSRPSTVELSDYPAYSPYYSTNNVDDTVKISALPFRAYESIYNAYYRNTVTQPFTINGQKRFNRYNTNLGDGADTFDYKLMQRNWELDAYTSCLPSPQQGNAPLVGMTMLGDVTIEDENGVTTAKYSEDGGEGKVVVTSPLASVSHGRILMDLAQSGISINDFRQCNALQRYLEQNIRSGYKYIDYIAGQFGVRPKYNELDMPEFIGGFTQRVDVGMISNTNGVIPSDSDAFLGSYAGQAKAFGGSPHQIKHYCDDYGFIVGVMMVVPDGAYSQVLPKHFIYNNQLDWYIPLFSEIGMQPITYEELCPVQSHYEHFSVPTKKLTDTFGYQRPNHELVWYPDTVHGQFRLSLRDFLINRVFQSRPELGNEFLIIKPEETNSIFNRTEPDEDVIIGQIVVKITAKRPVPRIVIPSLGR